MLIQQIIPWVKLVGIVGLILALLFGAYKAREYHLDAIDNAVNLALLKDNVREEEKRREIETAVRAKAVQERLELEKRVRAEREKVQKLEKMLLIDHDLDRLLQQKPGLILSRVNKGTAEYFKELEEATQ